MIALFDAANEEIHSVTTPVTELHLRLYIRQRTFEAKAALAQVHAFLASLDVSYELQVLDVIDNRELALRDQVPFTPLLIRLLPLPIHWIPMPRCNAEELRDEVIGLV